MEVTTNRPWLGANWVLQGNGTAADTSVEGLMRFRVAMYGLRH